MKKIAIMFLLLFSCCFMTGCFGSKKSDIASDFKKTVDKSRAYHLTGELEIVNNETSYLYDVETYGLNGEMFKVDLKNTINNHEQILLKNKKGVYV